MPKIIKNGKEYSGVPLECVTAWQPTGDSVQVAEPLMGNTDISDIGDGTITGAVSAVNEKSTWKLLQTVTGSTEISYPSEDYDELYFRALLVGTREQYIRSTTIPRIAIDTSQTLYVYFGEANSSGNIKMTSTTMNLFSYKEGSTTQTNLVQFSVFYR